MHGSSLAASTKVFFSCHKIFKTASSLKPNAAGLNCFVLKCKIAREVLMNQKKRGTQRGLNERKSHIHSLCCARMKLPSGDGGMKTEGCKFSLAKEKIALRALFNAKQFRFWCALYIKCG